ncbi:hypothetical protein PR048_009051 [Dryococelus australis]|uniref:Transposase Tc1-like domain-containing protein n=1 Tax=Dryococelus australis TaxID=614101 RepID=A0ABQ9HZ84_9NEOP|nr:hypothetical protein PR048_009051 [Dryococelus australis]
MWALPVSTGKWAPEAAKSSALLDVRRHTEHARLVLAATPPPPPCKTSSRCRFTQHAEKKFTPVHSFALSGDGALDTRRRDALILLPRYSISNLEKTGRRELKDKKNGLGCVVYAAVEFLRSDVPFGRYSGLKQTKQRFAARLPPRPDDVRNETFLVMNAARSGGEECESSRLYIDRRGGGPVGVEAMESLKEKRPPLGAPRAIDVRDERRLRRCMKANRQATVEQLTVQKYQGASRHVSIATVQRTLLQMGLQSKWSVIAPMLTRRRTDTCLHRWTNTRRWGQCYSLGNVPVEDGIFQHDNAPGRIAKSVRTWPEVQDQYFTVVGRTADNKVPDTRADLSEPDCHCQLRILRVCLLGTTVTERLVCLPPTKANRVHSPAGSLPDFRM